MDTIKNEFNELIKEIEIESNKDDSYAFFSDYLRKISVLRIRIYLIE